MRPPLYFLPANGFHASAYTPLTSLLSVEKVTPIHYPALKVPTPSVPNILSWIYFSNIVTPIIQSAGDGLVGLGHSIGGTLLLHQVIQRPSNWKAVFIVDPALFSSNVVRAYRMAQWFGLDGLVNPMVRTTKKRKIIFNDYDEVFDRWRKNPRFKNVSDEHLWILVKSSLVRKNDHQYTLRFSRDWEMAIYRSMCSLEPVIWRYAHRLKETNVIVITGDSSNTFLKGAQRQLAPYVTQWHVIPNTTHLVPLEAPHVMATIINDGLSI